MKYYKIAVILLFIFVWSCSKEDEVTIPRTVDPDPTANIVTQDFMWKAMNFWYFWQADVPNLADDKFPITDAGSEDYTKFLLSEDNPGDFFENQLKFSEDRFSRSNDDYKTYTQSQAGITKSNGLKFGLVNPMGTNDIFGYVRYVVAGSDASNKNIDRGDLFTGINGQALTLDNFKELLSTDTYTLNMAGFVDGEVTPNNQEITLTKQEALQENPIFLDKTFEIQGKKIGYLVYQAFFNEYDEQLNEVFGRFKSAGITDLVLDLRYNPGGSVATTIQLGSMIYDTNTNNLFLRQRWNDKQQARRLSSVDRFFRDKTSGGASINSVGLNKIYVLTTKSSASASELLINCLNPYIDIVQIGDTTRGKNEFSLTLVDDRDNNYVYSPARVDKIDKNNSWALQPLVGRSENSEGFLEYTNGLEPNIPLKEDLSDLGVFGDLNEPLLAKAIEEITNQSSKRDFTVQSPIEIYMGSEMFTPTRDNMYVNSLLNEE